MNPNVSCNRDDCKFSHSGGHSTCTYYQPIYDKTGKNINPDGNIHTNFISCLTCSKIWVAVTQYGKTIYTESK